MFVAPARGPHREVEAAVFTAPPDRHRRGYHGGKKQWLLGSVSGQSGTELRLCYLRAQVLSPISPGTDQGFHLREALCKVYSGGGPCDSSVPPLGASRGLIISTGTRWSNSAPFPQHSGALEGAFLQINTPTLFKDNLTRQFKGRPSMSPFSGSSVVCEGALLPQATGRPRDTRRPAPRT